jgi:hypothetical protein
MGVNGDVTLSNLKQASGIADDRLSAHDDNTGGKTSFGDFFITGFDRTDENGNGKYNLYILDVNNPVYPGDTVDLFIPNSISGSNDPNSGNATFALEIVDPTHGEFDAVKQIASVGGCISLSGVTSLTLQNIRPASPSTDSATMIRLRFVADDVSSTDSNYVNVTWDDPGINNDVNGLSAENPITWQSQVSVQAPPVEVITKNVTRSSNSASFDYEISEGDTDFDFNVTIDRRERDVPGDGNPDAWSSYTTLATPTYSGPGTHSFSDSGLSDPPSCPSGTFLPGTEYEWRVTVNNPPDTDQAKAIDYPAGSIYC